MTTTANIQSNGNGAVQNINMTEEGTMNRENNNINMVTRLSNNVRMGSMSRAARRCTTAAEESCTTGTMRKD